MDLKIDFNGYKLLSKKLTETKVKRSATKWFVYFCFLFSFKQDIPVAKFFRTLRQAAGNCSCLMVLWSWVTSLKVIVIYFTWLSHLAILLAVDSPQTSSKMNMFHSSIAGFYLKSSQFALKNGYLTSC